MSSLSHVLIWGTVLGVCVLQCSTVHALKLRINNNNGAHGSQQTSDFNVKPEQLNTDLEEQTRNADVPANAHDLPRPETSTRTKHEKLTGDVGLSNQQTQPKHEKLSEDVGMSNQQTHTKEGTPSEDVSLSNQQTQPKHEILSEDVSSSNQQTSTKHKILSEDVGSSNQQTQTKHEILSEDVELSNQQTSSTPKDAARNPMLVYKYCKDLIAQISSAMLRLDYLGFLREYKVEVVSTLLLAWRWVTQSTTNLASSHLNIGAGKN